MPKTLPLTPDWLSARVSGAPLSVDSGNHVIHGYVVAQKGPFKTPGRGEFDDDSLRAIVTLMNRSATGLKSRFGHPTQSDDGLGKFLGRARNARLDGDRVRADLHLDPSAFDTPHGDLGGYVLRLAASDPDAFSSSLVLKTKKVEQLDRRGRPILDANGKPKPPLWRPTVLHASDVVDTGDAVDGFLSIDGLPDAVVRQGKELLDRQFGGQSTAVIEARASAWLRRYLTALDPSYTPATLDPANDREYRRYLLSKQLGTERERELWRWKIEFGI